MRSILIKVAAIIAAAALVLAFTISAPADESYNDTWVLQYENMRDIVGTTYRIPTLYKNDMAFRNHRTFPLVVSGNIHYVPLEMFSGLSGISLNSSNSGASFYLSNEKNHSFISFDVRSGYVTTHEMKYYKLETRLYYYTRYVPAKAVADVLGIKMEIHEDLEGGIYALRFSDDKAKLDFAELVRMYTPIKKPIEDENKEDQVVTPPDDKVEDPVTPEMGARNIYLTFDMTDFRSLSPILTALKNGRITAAFFVSPEDMLRYPDDIRSIITSGHHIGILLDGKSPHTSLADGRSNLYLVAKRSTRLARFRGGSSSCVLSDTDLLNFTVGNGLSLWDYNISVADSQNMYTRLYDSLYSLGRTTAAIRISPGTNTASAITQLATLPRRNANVRFVIPDETAKSVRYR